MSTLTERLEADYKTAMKAQDRLRIDTIRMVKAAIQRVAIDKRTDVLSDPDVITVLNQQAKQRRETLEAGQKNGREDIASQASAELKILAGYLGGKVLTEKEVRILATLPPREVLLTRIAVMLKMPIQQIATVLNAPIQKLALVLKSLELEKANAAA